MKSIYFLLGFLLFTFLPGAFCQEEKDWTLLVYIVGSDLESGSGAASTDIAEMIAGATTTDYVNVLLLTGGANKPGWETPKSWIIENGQQVALDWTPSSDDMSNPGNVAEFINWGTQNYPAQSYMLTFWNHGGDFRGFGWVDGTENHLSIPQIQGAIGASSFITNGNKFDVIGFDACLMASLEVQCLLKDYAYYYVGSEETEPGHGWEWTSIIEAMEGGSALYGDQMGGVIVDSYRAHAMDYQTFGSGITLGIMDMEYISSLESKFQTLLDKIADESKVAALQQAVSATEEYGKAVQYPSTSSDVVDLGDLMHNLKGFDPSLATEVDEVLVALNDVVVYNTNDMARPKASGLTVYFPHNVLISQGELDYVIQQEYSPLAIPSAWKSFITDTYIPFVTSDNTSPGGFVSSNEDPSSIIGGNPPDTLTMSSLTITHDSDLEHVQIVLDEAFAGNPNEYILLGSTFPDSVIYIDENTETYVYYWDEQWLGINGHPAYISDIHDFQLEDEEGNMVTYHRIHIPAILNNGTPEEKNIMIGYRFDDNFNIELEGIMHEHNGQDSSRLVPKERIFLQPGDEVQLLYEVFNEVSDEAFFYEKPDAVITIENGNEDLHLEYDQLEAGTYKIGYVLLDHSHNDTIIFDDQVFEVIANSVIESFQENNIELYPNPSNQGFNINCPDQPGSHFTLQLTDINGRRILSQSFSQNTFVNTQNIPDGVYSIMLITEDKVFTDKILIQH